MRVLSVDGGGYLGLATAAFIQSVESHFDTTFHDSFDLFCGTSTGAIIALALASGRSGEEIVALYRQLGATVFSRRRDVSLLARAAPGVFRARFRLAALADALHGSFADRTLGDLLTTGKKALVTSYCVSTGRPRVFKTDHSSSLTLHNRYRLADIALASSAAPTYFALAALTNPLNGVEEVFCDGGVAANHPALLGYAEALYEFGASPGQIRVLSISTPRADLAERTSRGSDRGLIGWRRTLPAILIDSPSEISHQLMRRLVESCAGGRPVYERVELSNPDRIPFDRADDEATRQLMLIGGTAAAPAPVRDRLAPFFASGVCATRIQTS
jgi:patatin-like phospholipase/acyl hydrolase